MTAVEPLPSLARASWALLAACAACGGGAPTTPTISTPRASTPPVVSAARSEPAVVASYAGGTVTREEVLREAGRMPPALRERFESSAGRGELARSLVDKRLLVQEARRRGFSASPDIHRQVEELEERLIVQALLADAEKAQGQPTEPEARVWYDANKKELGEPERIRVVRVLASVPRSASKDLQGRARARAERFRSRLRGGEAAAKVAADGEGPERLRGGDLGLLARGDRRDGTVEAGFALEAAGDVSEVVASDDGFFVLQLVERRPARIPPFEAVRTEVETRLQPGRQRRAFDTMLGRLRKEAGVEIDVAALK